MKNVVRDLRMGTALVGAARRMGAVFGLALLGAVASPALAEPLRIEINNPVIEAMPFAIPDFQAESSGAGAYGADIARVVAADLSGTGLFREIPASAFVSNASDFNAPVDYANWRAVNAQALIKGSVSTGAGGALTVKFRLFDVPSGQQMGTGLQFSGTVDGLRRMGHKVADWVYQQITGEGPYFDSRVAFVSVSGPKNARLKRLAIMDYDGANVSYLTGSDALVLTPRFSPAGDRVLYTSYETGQPQIFALDVATAGRKALGNAGGNMAFSPRFAPDARSLVFSVEQGGNSDIYSMDTNGGSLRRLTDAPSIETAPSYAPDGSRIVFESDRSGTQQLYIMSAGGGEAQRISFGPGRYGTPVWSPRGDFIAFTKQNEGRFHIGVMRTDGSDERLLTSSFLDEGPSWSPNGRVIMFTRETQGADGGPSLFSVDISGRNLRKVPTPGFASSPAWSPLKP